MELSTKGMKVLAEICDLADESVSSIMSGAERLEQDLNDMLWKSKKQCEYDAFFCLMFYRIYKIQDLKFADDEYIGLVKSKLDTPSRFIKKFIQVYKNSDVLHDNQKEHIDILCRLFDNKYQLQCSIDDETCESCQ